MINLGINKQLFSSSTTTTTILHNAYPPSHHHHPHFIATTITITNGRRSHPSPTPITTTTSITSTTSQLNKMDRWGVCRCHVAKSDVATKQRMMTMLSFIFAYMITDSGYPLRHSISLTVTTQHTCAHKRQTSSREQRAHADEPQPPQLTTQPPRTTTQPPRTTTQPPRTTPNTHKQRLPPTNKTTTQRPQPTTLSHREEPMAHRRLPPRAHNQQRPGTEEPPPMDDYPMHARTIRVPHRQRCPSRRTTHA